MHDPTFWRAFGRGLLRITEIRAQGSFEETTVKLHVRQIMENLNAANRTQPALVAQQMTGAVASAIAFIEKLEMRRGRRYPTGDCTNGRPASFAFLLSEIASALFKPCRAAVMGGGVACRSVVIVFER
jgi:hypothetical protein